MLYEVITKTVNGASDMDVLDISAPGDEEPILLLRGADWLTEGQVDTLLDNWKTELPRFVSYNFV